MKGSTELTFSYPTPKSHGCWRQRNRTCFYKPKGSKKPIPEQVTPSLFFWAPYWLVADVSKCFCLNSLQVNVEEATNKVTNSTTTCMLLCTSTSAGMRRNRLEHQSTPTPTGAVLCRDDERLLVTGILIMGIVRLQATKSLAPTFPRQILFVITRYRHNKK